MIAVLPPWPWRSRADAVGARPDVHDRKETTLLRDVGMHPVGGPRMPAHARRLAAFTAAATRACDRWRPSAISASRQQVGTDAMSRMSPPDRPSQRIADHFRAADDRAHQVREPCP